MLYGGSAVDEVGNSDADYSVACVVFCSAPCVVFGALYALFKADGECGNGTVEADFIYYVACLYDNFDDVVKLIFKSFHKIIEGLECHRISGLSSGELAALSAHAVQKSELHHASEVDIGESRIAAEFAGKVSLYTAARIPVESFSDRNTFVHQHADSDFVVMKCGESRSEAHKLNYLAKEGVGILGHVVANRERGLIELCIHSSLEYHVGKVVDGILSSVVNSAGTEILKHGIARSVLRRLRILEEALFGELDPEAVKEFLSFFRRDSSLFEVGLVEGIEILVHTSRVVGSGILLHEYANLIEVEGLHGLDEGSGRFCWNSAACFRYALKFLFALAVFFQRGEALCFYRIALRKSHHSLRYIEE